MCNHTQTQHLCGLTVCRQCGATILPPSCPECGRPRAAVVQPDERCPTCRAEAHVLRWHEAGVTAHSCRQ